MGQMSENILLMDNRVYMYRLLGRIYKEEVDQTLLNQLKMLRFNECDEGELSEGYRQFEAYFHQTHLDPLSDLAVDYARVFLGAGIFEGTVADPYESVYTSSKRLIMQDARDEVLAMYREFGLDKDEKLNIPEDHISLEFEFMVYLCQACKEALQNGEYDKAEVLVQTQADFLKKHLLNWIPQFCDDILKCSQTEFYKAVAKLTRGYLHLEEEMLEYLATSVLISARKAEAHAEHSQHTACSCH